MAPPILNSNQSLESLYEELVYTQVALAADSEAEKQALTFETLISKAWTTALQKERLLRFSYVSALVVSNRADRRLDGWTDRFHNALLIVTDNRRDMPLYQRYFGAAPPSVLKRPVLGLQLVTLSGWVPSIKAAAPPALKTLGNELETLVGAGQKAEEALRAARAELKDFRELGERKALFDQANALRQAVGGTLAEFVHANPAKNLPTDWSDGFFRHHERPRNDPTDRTRLQEEIAATKQELAEKEQRLAELEAQSLVVQQAASERAAATAKLQELEQQARQAEEQAQALRAKLGPPEKQPKRRKK